MQRSTTSPDDFIRALPDDVRADIATLDAEIATIMAGRERVLWEGAMWGGTHQRIVGYGAYRRQGRTGDPVEWFVIGLAAQKRYISLYVSAVDDGAYLVKTFADRLGKVKVGSANITFRRLAEVDRAALSEMLERARDLTSDD